MTASSVRALEVHRALDRVHQVGNQIVAPLELHVDLLPGVGHLVLERDEAVVGADDPQDDDHKDDQQDDRAHVGSYGQSVYRFQLRPRGRRLQEPVTGSSPTTASSACAAPRR